MPHRVVPAIVVIASVALNAAVARAQNAPPTAREVDLTTAMQTAATGLLDGSDPNGDSLTFSILTGPQKGTVVLTDVHTGAFVYTPNEGRDGADLFTFEVSDGAASSAPAAVAIAIAEAHTENIARGKRAAAAPVGEELVPAPEIVDGDLSTSWKSAPDATGNLAVAINLGENRRIWRIVIHWAPGRHARLYEIGQLNTWYATDAGDGGIDDIQISTVEKAPAFRLAIVRSPDEIDRIYEIQEIEVYAAESLNHASRNPPHLVERPIGLELFAALTDGDAGTIFSGPLPYASLTSLAMWYPNPEISRIVLFWGDAYASRYQIVGRGGTCVVTTFLFEKSDGRGGVEIIDLPPGLDKGCVRLNLLEGPSDHFDLREVEFYGPLPGNAAAGKNTVASSEASSAQSSAAAVDRDLQTEWASAADTDTTWWLVDIGDDARRNVCGMRIWWGEHFPRHYAVFVLAEDSQTFEPYYATDKSDGGLDDIGVVLSPFRVRYIVIVADPSPSGYSIREFESYRCLFASHQSP